MGGVEAKRQGLLGENGEIGFQGLFRPFITSIEKYLSKTNTNTPKPRHLAVITSENHVLEVE